MNLLISLSAAIAPAILLLFYFYKQDKAKSEPKKIIIKILLAGIISTIPAIILEILTALTIIPLLIICFLKLRSLLKQLSNWTGKPGEFNSNWIIWLSS